MKSFVAFLMLAIVPNVVLASSTKIGRANAEVSTLTHATELLIQDIRAAPEPSDWPDALLHRQEKYPDWDGPHLTSIPLDPWGNHYQLKAVNKSLIGVYSFGMNRIDEHGGGDDVSSWSGYDNNIYHPNRERSLVIMWAIAASIILIPVYLFFRNLKTSNID